MAAAPRRPTKSVKSVKASTSRNIWMPFGPPKRSNRPNSSRSSRQPLIVP